MSDLQFLHEFVHHELAQKENLFTLLASFKGSRSPVANTSIASIVRGLCTNNQKILRSAQQCLADSSDSDLEPLKVFANETVMWFDQTFVVFEKFLSYLSKEQLADACCEKTVLHCSCYIRLLEVLSASIRNPFVVTKLGEATSRVRQLLADFDRAKSQSDLDNITFDHVRSLSGHNVSCFFTVDQIVKRTENASIFMKNRRVELLLLNLDRTPGSDQKQFNSLAILACPPQGQPRSVIYPPFRVNELSMALAQDSITFSAFAADLSSSFVISGDSKLLEKWFHNLTKIFPTSDTPLTSSSLQLHGLGINMPMADVSSNSSSDEPLTDEPIGNDNYEHSKLSSSNSFQIMKKSLSGDGIEPEVKHHQLKVIPASQGRSSITTQYDFAGPGDEDDVKSEKEKSDDVAPKEDVNSPSSLDCFDIVATLPKTEYVQNENATKSMPDLSAQPPSVYLNSTGSAIDVSQFGKNHNPTFSSAPRQRRKSLFSIFKKTGKENKSQTLESRAHNESQAQNQTREPKPSEELAQGPKSNKQPQPAKNRYRPELQIEIPKISALDANTSQPSSATSNNRTLPSPFALPSSTSTYFFKPYVNNSSSTLPGTEDTEVISLSIPRELKDLINSDNTIDYYMSPISSTALKVSKWKAAFAKWELVTLNEKVFVKVVSHNLTRSWMLVFKEEVDDDNEVVDKPLLILELNESTKVRQSSALDVEVKAVNAITRQNNVIMIRCNASNLAKDISASLTEVRELRDQKLSQSSRAESSMTITSSLMSKPSASSTVSSLYTQLDTCEKDRVLLDRMTVRVHRQKESYENIHMPSSWETMAMYSLSISHSSGSEKGVYHFDLDCKSDADDMDLSWTFSDDKLLSQIERIGKAGMLVRVSESEMYMLECKGRKEFERLMGLF